MTFLIEEEVVWGCGESHADAGDMMSPVFHKVAYTRLVGCDNAIYSIAVG